MLSDIEPDITDPDDDKMNFALNQCPYCGMTEVRWDTAENEKEQFPYWKDDTELKRLLKGYELDFVVYYWAEANGKIKDFPFESQEVADTLKKIAKKIDHAKENKN